MRKGIVFDLDGTLWDVSKTTYDSVNQVAKNHNLKEVTIDTIYNVFGLTEKEALKKYFPTVEIQKALKLGDEISDILISRLFKYGGSIYDGVEETLKILKKEKYNLFIVSNAGRKKYIEAFFNCSKLREYFIDYFAASELNLTKAETIKKVISKYNLERCVYVGDTKADLEATINAEIPFIHAKYGFGYNVNTKYSIQNIKELQSVVNLVMS